MWRLGRQPGLSASLDAGGVLVLCSASLHLDEDEQICSVNLNLMFYRNVREKNTGRKYFTFAYGRNIGLYIHIFGGKLVQMSRSPERLMGPLLITVYYPGH